METAWIRWGLYASIWLLLVLGGREWARQRGKPVPLAYLLLVGILVILQLYSELSFK